MDLPTVHTPSVIERDWRARVASYQNPDLQRSLVQVVNTLVPYLLLWYLMIRSLAYSYWLTLGLALVAGGLLLRVFIIFHDCGHNSFFASRRANTILGVITGLLVFTPYHRWRHEHAVHHATVGDLDRRGHGDVHTLTVREYADLTRWKQVQYRLFRHPLVLLGLGPLYTFLVAERFTLGHTRARERTSVYATNAALLLLIAGVAWWIGLSAYLLIQVPVMLVAATVGVWMFYVQHQFEDAHWVNHDEWDYATAALQGSSYLRLPPVLQWFTGNIGFHHIHHLSARIPNYRLQQCHDENPQFQNVHILTVREGIQALNLSLWDEERQALISFQQARGRKAVQGVPPTTRTDTAPDTPACS